MKNILKNILTIKIIFLIIVLNFSFLNLENANAAINKQINYQGRLLDSVGDPVANAGFNIQFKLYTVSTGGTAVWTETHCYSPDAGTTCDGTGTDSRVDTVDGLFSVMLGSINSLDSVDFNQTLYLGINIGGTATTPSYDGEMSPRKILGSVPAAFEADKLDGINSAQFFRNDVANSTSSANTFFSLVQSGAGKVMELFGSGMSSLFTVLSGGNVGIGTSTPEYDLQIHRDSGQTDFAITTNTNIGSANTATIQFISDNDGTQNPAILGQFNDGSLRFSGGGNIVTPDMVITDVGYVGIGTTSPYAKLSVNGSAAITGALYDGTASAGTNGYVLQTTGTGIAWVATSSIGIIDPVNIGESIGSGTAGSVLFVNSSGNLAQDNTAFYWDSTSDELGIGVSNPTAKLDISLSGSSAGTVGLQVRGGNSTGNFGTSQIAFGYSTYDLYRHAIKTRHNNISAAENAIDFFVWDYAVDAAETIGTKNVMSLLGNGNVGIGTTSPYAKLSVNGSAAITGALYDGGASAGTNGYILQTTGTGISWVATSSIGIIDPVNIGESIGSGTAGSVLFVDSSGNLAQDNAAFYWDTTNDRLGIGTNSPDYALDVSGQKIGIDGNQVIYRPDQTNFSGTLIVGNGGGSLSHTSGTEGWENTYVGINAGSGNTTGLRNTGVGAGTMIANTTGFQNNAFGSLALDANSTASNNSAFGYASLTNSNASNNSAFGNYSLGQITSGHTNSAFGYLAGYYLADGVTTLQTGNTSTYFGANTRASADGVANENVFGYGATGAGANSAVIGNSSVTKTILNGNVGIGSTSPNSKLVVSGETLSNYFTATSTTASSTLPNLDATNIEVAGKLYDGTASAGTNGYVLQTTGTGIAWVATSSLGTVINPGGSNTQVQFNDSGSFGGDSGFTYNKTTDTLSVNGGVEGVTGDYSYSLTSLSGLSLADDSVSKTSNYNASSISFDSSTFLSTNYLNFTSTIGSSGYGIRNNAGTIEFRNSAGDWTSFDALEPSQPIYAIGSVSAYSGSSLPSGWLWADGSAISRTTYADLFALIGTTYGSGDGSTTFNLPDLRGRTIAGKDNMDNTEGTGGGDAARLTSASKAAIDGDTLGASGGVQEYTLQAEESGLPAHTHTYLDYYHASVVTRGTGASNTASAGYGATSRTSDANTAQDAAEAHTNVQPTLVLNYIIRYTNSEANAAFWSLNGSSLYNTTASVGIGTTTPARALHVAISTDGAPVRFQDSNGYCEINPTSTTWTCTSDERLKENILSVSSSTPDLFERMMKLRPVTFEWKTDETNAQRVGFIAQEVEVLFPEFVSTDAESGLKSVSYGSFVPYVISMFQELANKVELLAKKIDDLTSSGLAAVGGVITKLTIGSSEKPTGITLFDESTGDPYCVSVKNGNMVTKFGECTTEDDQEIGDSNDDVQNNSYISNIEESDEQDIPYPDNIQNSPDPVEESDEVTEQSDFSENTLEQSDITNTANITEAPEVEPEVEIGIVNEDDVVVETNSASGSVEIPLE